MKFLLIISLFLVCSFHSIAQSSATEVQNLFCINCGFDRFEEPGSQYEIGFDLSKAITQRYSILTGVSINFWRRINSYSNTPWGTATSSSKKQFLPSIAFNFGQRFILKSFDKTALFTETNFHIEGYAKSTFKRWSISLEPTLGFSRKFNQRNDFYFSFGYDKLLSNFSSYTSQVINPGRLNFKVGMTYNLLPKIKSAAEEAE